MQSQIRHPIGWQSNNKTAQLNQWFYIESVCMITTGGVVHLAAASLLAFSHASNSRPMCVKSCFSCRILPDCRHPYSGLPPKDEFSQPCLLQRPYGTCARCGVEPSIKLQQNPSVRIHTNSTAHAWHEPFRPTSDETVSVNGNW
jgi:hypothetical protein